MPLTVRLEDNDYKIPVQFVIKGLEWVTTCWWIYILSFATTNSCLPLYNPLMERNTRLTVRTYLIVNRSYSVAYSFLFKGHLLLTTIITESPLKIPMDSRIIVGSRCP